MANFDWSRTLIATYPPEGGRIIRYLTHRPGRGAMTDRWTRDDGRRYLRAIMDETGRSLVPEPLVPGQAKQLPLLCEGGYCHA